MYHRKNLTCRTVSILSLNYLHLRAFCRRLLSKATYSNSYIHTLMVLAARCRTTTSRAVWSSVSCPWTLRHIRGNEPATFLLTRCWLYPWATARLFITHLFTLAYNGGVFFSTSLFYLFIDRNWLPYWQLLRCASVWPVERIFISRR